MNVKELIEILQNFSNDTIVRFSYDNRDYWHHQIAKEVKFVDLMAVKYNTYVDNHVINDNAEGEFLEDENYAVILS